MKLLPARRKRAVLTLQLTAMIDIFSLIVIFLIKGTVFATSDIAVPPGMRLPSSISKESAESAPRVTIAGDSVIFSPFTDKIPLSAFHGYSTAAGGTSDPGLQMLKSRIKKFIAGLPSEARSSGVLLNVIADQRTPYRDIFDTVQFFRSCGFQSLLFVAQGESNR